MQTFLPYPAFAASAKVLDRQRLGKQRIEAKQILQTLLGQSLGWQHHPAVKMWRGHEYALAHYGLTVCREWRNRGYQDRQFDWFFELTETMPIIPGYPAWFGRDDFHASHRSNLIRKLPEWYVQFGWKEPADLPYVWS